MSPVPASTETVAPVPADVTVTAGSVPIWIDPSVPVAALKSVRPSATVGTAAAHDLERGVGALVGRW